MKVERYFEINGQGHNVRCKLYYQDLHNIQRVVLFCSGFGGHKDNRAAEKFAQRMLSKYKRTALVTFNWPCHGDDVKKKLTLRDCNTYLQLVIAHVQDHFQPQALYAYVTSFGGYVLLQYISEHGNPFKKIALRCPAVNMYEVLAGHSMSQEDLLLLHKGKEVPVGFDRKVPITQAFLEELRQHDICKREFFDFAEDMLILQGTGDEVVSPQAVFDFADNNLIECIPVPGADHRFQHPEHMEQAIKAILSFFAL